MAPTSAAAYLKLNTQIFPVGADELAIRLGAVSIGHYFVRYTSP